MYIRCSVIEQAVRGGSVRSIFSGNSTSLPRISRCPGIHHSKDSFSCLNGRSRIWKNTIRVKPKSKLTKRDPELALFQVTVVSLSRLYSKPNTSEVIITLRNILNYFSTSMSGSTSVSKTRNLMQRGKYKIKLFRP